MTEQASDTSDHQRFEEMWVHLTPQGASVPYGICYDPQGNVWVASKGGLFKFDGRTKKVLFKKKNPFPNKMAPFSQVLFFDDQIIYTCAEHKDGQTQLCFMNLDGTETHMQLVDGLIQSLVINGKGDIYVTKIVRGLKSSIWWTSMDAPLGWEELMSTEEYAFETLGVVDDETLVVSTVELPKNMYAKQALRLINIEGAKITKSFSETGKEPGKIQFPRAIKRLEDMMIILDKSGRFQRFTPEGIYVDTIAEIDAYLANGFTIVPKEEGNGDEHVNALCVLSGVVRDTDNQAICDDWLEFVPFDHSSWRAKRALKAQA